MKKIFHQREDGSRPFKALRGIKVILCRSKKEFKRQLRFHVKTGTACYLHSIERNWATYDSVVYLPGVHDELFFFQITQRGSHSIPVSGFRTALSWLNPPASWSPEEKKRMKALRPTKDRPFNLVFWF
jgi:hypothetical protein